MNDARPSGSGTANDEAEPAETRIGPVTLDWKVNVTALVAFAVSMFALALQAMGYWRGSIVTLQPAEKVLIAIEGPAVRIGARMVYTNDGASGYNALILRESVVIRVGGDEYRQWAEERGSFDLVDGEPALLGAVDAAPFMVPAMQLVTHESHFAARERGTGGDRWRDRITREQLVSILESGHAADTIELVFQARSREISGFRAGNEKTLTTTCVLTLDKGLVRRMRNEGWSSRSCRGFDG